MAQTVEVNGVGWSAGEKALEREQDNLVATKFNF